jgi:hypothetical protein
LPLVSHAYEILPVALKRTENEVIIGQSDEDNIWAYESGWGKLQNKKLYNFYLHSA